MKGLGKRVLRKHLSKLAEAIRAAEMVSSHFNKIGYIDPENEGELPKTEAEVTDFIKKRTRVHHQTWIIAPIRALMKDIQKAIESKD